jgi:hypothetical protein
VFDALKKLEFELLAFLEQEKKLLRKKAKWLAL